MNITIRNVQKDLQVRIPQLREIIARLARTEFADLQGECCFHLVSKPEMAELNQRFLNHEGATDVITFDWIEDPESDRPIAEIFLCPAVAREQAAAFQTTWQDELIRYLIHALLHLQGFDDRSPEDRRIMKRHENRILNAMRQQSDGKLG